MDARKQEVLQELARRGLSSPQSAMQSHNEQESEVDPFTGSARGLKDVGGDLMQGLANARNQGNKFIAPVTEPIRQLIPEKYRGVPELGKHEFEGKNPDEMTQGITQYGLPLVAGGGDALKTTLLSALYGMTQAEPGKRAKGAATDTLLAGLIPAVGKQFGKAIGAAGKYLHPEAEARELLQSLHGGTSQENIDTLAKRLAFANKSAEQEALIPKGQLMSTEAKSEILPEVPTKQPNLTKIAKVFGESPDKHQISELGNITKEYYKTGDIDSFISKSEELFDHPGLTDAEEFKIESMLPFEKRKLQAGSYLKTKGVTDPYSNNGELIQLHEQYAKHPNFENSDELISKIKAQERKYQGTKEDVGIRKLEELKRNREALERDQEKFFETLPKEKQELYKDFREKYRANKQKYEEKKTPVLTKLASKEPGGVTSANVRKQFSGNLRENVEQALRDIGSSGEGNILYNELAGLKPGNIDALAEKFQQLEQTGGMQRYTDSHKALVENLAKRLKHRRYATGAGLAGAGGLAAYGGYPGTGKTLAGAGGATAIGAVPLSQKLFKLLIKSVR